MINTMSPINNRTIQTNEYMQETYDEDAFLVRLIANREKCSNRSKYWRHKLKQQREEQSDLRRMMRELKKDMERTEREKDKYLSKTRDARSAVTTRKRILYDLTYKKRHAQIRKDMGLPALKSTETHKHEDD